MPLKIEPEVDLEDLTYNYPLDLLEFFESCLPGIKYINIRKYQMRDQYDKPCFKVIVQEKPQPLQKPPSNEVTSKTLADNVMKILQYQVESNDAAGKYKIEVYRNTTKSENTVKAKHIDIAAPGTSNEAKSFVPQEMEQDVLASQGHYIVMMHEQMLKMSNVIIQIVSPLMEQIKQYQENAQKHNQAMVEMAKMERNFLLIQREQEDNLKLEMIKQQASKEKWKQMAATLKDSGAVQQVMEVIKSRVSGMTGGSGVNPSTPVIPSQDQQVEAIRRKQASAPQNKTSQATNESVKDSSKNSESEIVNITATEVKTPTDEDLQKQKEELDKLGEELDDQFSRSPLFVLCSSLCSTLSEDPEQEKFIKDVLREQVYNKLNKLINSESEESAITNLISLRDSITMDDYKGLMEINEILNDTQKMIIQNIMDFKLPGEE